MNILVCISNVPDTTTKITFIDNNTHFNSAGVQFIINPYDEIALARALEITDSSGGTVTVINVGEASAEPVIRKALAIGASGAVRINAAPHDAFFVAYQIAAYVRENPFDLILTGRESIDYNGSNIAGMLGELLGQPSVSIIKKIEVSDNQGIVEREIEGGKEIISIPLPFIAGVAEGVAEIKLANMRGIMAARTKPLDILEPVAVTVNSAILSYETPAPRGDIKLVDPGDEDQLVKLLHNEAGVI